MRFIIDANLPPRLSIWLAQRGHECAHVDAIGLVGSTDSAIWSHALKTGAAIISKDQDFADRARVSALAPCVVWLRTGNGSVASRISILNQALPAIEAPLVAGETLIEIRR